jgi:site-specific recombinase XerD
MKTQITLKDFEQHLRGADRSENTITGYGDDLADFAKWFETTNTEPLTPANITPSDVRAYKQHLLNRKLKLATINRRLASLSAYARWAIEAGQIESDPTAKIQPVKQVQAGPKWLDRKQRFVLQRIVEQQVQLAAVRPEGRRSLWRLRDAMLITVMTHTGLRVAEVAGLDLSDVELKPRSGKITVRGKGTEIRTVPLNVEARTALERWLALRPPVETPAVFVSQFLLRMTTRSVERVVAEYGQRAKLDTLTPHMLRHTFAKTLVDRGIPIDQVSTLLGHANLNTTRIYTTPGERDLERAMVRDRENQFSQYAFPSV